MDKTKPVKTEAPFCYGYGLAFVGYRFKRENLVFGGYNRTNDIHEVQPQ